MQLGNSGSNGHACTRPFFLTILSRSSQTQLVHVICRKIFVAARGSWCKITPVASYPRLHIKKPIFMVTTRQKFLSAQFQCEKPDCVHSVLKRSLQGIKIELAKWGDVWCKKKDIWYFSMPVRGPILRTPKRTGAPEGGTQGNPSFPHQPSPKRLVPAVRANDVWANALLQLTARCQTRQTSAIRPCIEMVNVWNTRACHPLWTNAYSLCCQVGAFS